MKITIYFSKNCKYDHKEFSARDYEEGYSSNKGQDEDVLLVKRVMSE
jgi:hypothetical protein